MRMRLLVSWLRLRLAAYRRRASPSKKVKQKEAKAIPPGAEGRFEEGRIRRRRFRVAWRPVLHATVLAQSNARPPGRTSCGTRVERRWKRRLQQPGDSAPAPAAS